MALASPRNSCWRSKACGSKKLLKEPVGKRTSMCSPGLGGESLIQHRGTEITELHRGKPVFPRVSFSARFEN